LIVNNYSQKYTLKHDKLNMFVEKIGKLKKMC
jgi:hypothetical protein